MSTNRQHPVISMVAGETSGDMLAARLLSGLRPRLPESLMHGIGGPRMAEYGFVNDWPMEKLSSCPFTLTEVLDDDFLPQ